MRAKIFAPENRKWWTLAAVTFGLFMIMLDNTVVNVALPSIQRDFGVRVSELEWVVNAYALVFAVLMLTGGKLADLFGRRLIFIAGLVVFTASSLACGLAGDINTLIAARAVQGIGAAMMNPATLSIVTATFPPRERCAALGIWAGVSAMALAIGPLVGGLITEHVNWQWIFFINVPIGALGVLASRIFIQESRDTSHVQRLDLPGLATSAAGLFALTYALTEGNKYGWSSPRILGLLAGAAVLLAAFVLLELHQRVPMLDVTLFRDRTFAGANVTALLVTLAMFGVFFFISIFMQTIIRYSPVQAGAAFLPMTILIILIAPIAGRQSDRIGSRWLMSGGMAFVAVSLLVYAQLSATSVYWDLLPAMIIGGVGMACVMTPMTAAALGAVPVDKAGVGSGVLNTFRQVGGSLGIALMGAIMAAKAGSMDATHVDPQRFVSGLSYAMYVSAGIAFAASLVAATTVRQRRHVEAPAVAEIAA